LSGEGSARKASVTPRMGSLGAGSTWPNSDDAIALAACSLDGCTCGRRVRQEAARDSAAMPGRTEVVEELGGAAEGGGGGKMGSLRRWFCLALN